MFRSIINNASLVSNKILSLNHQTIRGIKNRGEYIKRYGYKYTDHFKGGK